MEAVESRGLGRREPKCTKSPPPLEMLRICKARTLQVARGGRPSRHAERKRNGKVRSIERGSIWFGADVARRHALLGSRSPNALSFGLIGKARGLHLYAWRARRTRGRTGDGSGLSRRKRECRAHERNRVRARREQALVCRLQSWGRLVFVLARQRHPIAAARRPSRWVQGPHHFVRRQDVRLVENEREGRVRLRRRRGFVVV